MPLFRSKAEDKVREAGYDPARLPPGQYFTEKWPVLHAGEVPDVDIATWTLELSDEVEQPTTLSFDQLLELPATEVTSDIHCVTRWSRFDAKFKGVHWRELANLCHPKPSAHFAVAQLRHHRAHRRDRAMHAARKMVEEGRHHGIAAEPREH